MSVARTVVRLRARTGAQQPPHDLEAEIAPEVTVGAFADAVADRLDLDGTTKLAAVLERTGATLRGDQPLLSTGLRNGDTLALRPVADAPIGPPPPRNDPSRFDLVVVGGPAAGRMISLAPGDYVIGRDASCDVTVEDPSMSRRHLRVKIDGRSVTVVDPGSNNGTWVRDQPLRHNEPYTLQNGEVLRLARTLIAIRPSRPRLDALSSDGSGNVNFNRPPRVPRPWRPQKVNLPAPPGKPSKAKLPLVAALIPLVLGGVMYLIYPNPIMIAFMLMAPVMAVFSFVEERRGGKKAGKEALTHWNETLAKLHSDLRALAVEEERERNFGAPDAGELIHRAVSHSADLWERRPTDPDFLHVRIGTADQRAQYELSIESGGEDGQRRRATDVESKHRTIPAAPVMVAVPDAGAVGLGGAPQGVVALTRWLLVQAITLHSPRELAVAIGVRPELVPEFGWLKWAPHVQRSGSPIEGDPLAVGQLDTRRLVEEVIALQRRRREEEARLGGALGSGRRMFLLLVLDEQVAPQRSLIAELLGATGRYDIAVLWLGHTMRDLPGECRVTIEHDAHLASVILTDARTGAVVGDVTVDGMTRANAREVALGLAPVRDTSTSGLRSGIPSRITLLELLGAKEHDAADVMRRWGEDAERTLGAPIGAGGEGPLHVDLRADGPHALIGGTTGAGKSELLQSLVGSLALRHPPTRLTFLLVDYKGGAAFKECVGLPHTVGFVTDLDSHLTQRALTSLNAELKRREHVLRDAGAKDLIDMERRSSAAPPSLVIVIDEFATLAKEVPEFVEGVVDVAQRGRSLGVHLVLATQRPGGVVSDNIRANVNLRIALRMAAPAESADIVGVTDAARIARSQPGRAFARVGQAELTEFQSAYVGGITTISSDGPPIELREFGFGPPPDAPPPARSSTAYGTVATDLEELVKAVNEAAEIQQLPPQPSPWLPALEPIVPLASLDPTRDPVATFGVIDEPSRQRRTPLTHDFENDGSLLIYGASGSGKTTALRTIAVALAAQTPPERLHIYGLDFATRGLNSLEGLPHCGGVVLGEDEERVTRLLQTIRKTLAVRRERFAARGAFTLSEYNRAAPEGEQLPRIVVLFDGYAAFYAAFERINLGELVDLMPRLIADSRPLGIHFVITAERRAAISGALSGIITSRLILRMADPDEYSSLGLDIRTVKDMKLPAGRGFVTGSLEAQVALVGDDASGEGQLAAVAAAARALRERFGDGHVPPIAPLPTAVERAVLPVGGQMRPVVGLGDDELQALSVDLQDAHFLIAGPYRSGRSTTLETVARSLLAADPGAQVHLLAPRRSPLPNASVAWTSVSRGVEDCDAKASELAALASELEEGDRPLFVLVDDGDELGETMGASSLEQMVRRGRDVPVRLVVAAETQAVMRAYGGWLRELRKDEHGLLLDPDLDVDGDLLGVRLPRRSNAVFPVGRGYYVYRGSLELVQVAS